MIIIILILFLPLFFRYLALKVFDFFVSNEDKLISKNIHYHYHDNRQVKIYDETGSISKKFI